MQALVQRVSSAEISIDDLLHAKINCGLLAFICFELGDTVAAIDKFISKISSFCFFDDDSRILASNLREIHGELMIVSQFTLAAVTKKGNKCVNWQDQNIDWTTIGLDFSYVGDHNYCRNPYPDAASETPWCFYEDKNVAGGYSADSCVQSKDSQNLNSFSNIINDHKKILH